MQLSVGLYTCYSSLGLNLIINVSSLLLLLLLIIILITLLILVGHHTVDREVDPWDGVPHISLPEPKDKFGRKQDRTTDSVNFLIETIFSDLLEFGPGLCWLGLVHPVLCVRFLSFLFGLIFASFCMT